jgi:hypothetical protein
MWDSPEIGRPEAHRGFIWPVLAGIVSFRPTCATGFFHIFSNSSYAITQAIRLHVTLNSWKCINKLTNMDWTTGIRFSVRSRFSYHHVQTTLRVRSLPCQMAIWGLFLGKVANSVKLTTHLHLLLWSSVRDLYLCPRYAFVVCLGTGATVTSKHTNVHMTNVCRLLEYADSCPERLGHLRPLIAWTVGSWVRIPPKARMSVDFLYFVVL